MTNDKPIMTADTRPTVTIMPTKLAKALTALVPLADAACDYADQNCRAFPIATCKAPTDNLIWDCEEEEWVKGRVYFLAQPERYTHWAETPPPPSNPPLPAVFTELGQALEKIKGAG